MTEGPVQIMIGEHWNLNTEQWTRDLNIILPLQPGP